MRLPKMYHFILDDIPSYVYDIVVSKRPNIPAPSKDYYSPGDVIGVDGSSYEDLGTFRNVEVELECSFISENTNDWHKQWRKIKNWILGTKHKIYKFSDDEGYYRKIAKITLGTSEREAKEIGSFSIKFEFEPFEYLDEGKFETNYKNITKNEYYTAKPIYILNCSGDETLMVNKKSFKVNGQGLIYIDSDLKIAYSNDSLVNVIGDFDDLWLPHGDCSISATCDCKVIPNWRCI